MTGYTAKVGLRKPRKRKRYTPYVWDATRPMTDLEDNDPPEHTEPATLDARTAAKHADEQVDGHEHQWVLIDEYRDMTLDEDGLTTWVHQCEVCGATVTEWAYQP